MTPETVEIAGVRIPIDPAIMSDKIQQQLRAGRWEDGETAVLPTIVAAGDRVIDLGAGIGFLAAFIGLLRKAELIVAVEANPELMPLIGALAGLNGVEIEALNALVAIETTSPTHPFYLHNDLWASSPIRIKDSSLRGVVELPVTTLEALAAEFSPTLMIIDLEVMRGFLADGAAVARTRLGAANLPGVTRILAELKPTRFTPAEVQAIFDGLSNAGFGYDPGLSRSELVVFSRV